MKKKQYVSPLTQIVVLGSERVMFTVSPGVSTSEWKPEDGFGAKRHDLVVDDFDIDVEEEDMADASISDFIPKKFKDVWNDL